MKHNPTDTITYAELDAALTSKRYTGGLHADILFDAAEDAREPKNITPSELHAELAKYLKMGAAGLYMPWFNGMPSTPHGFVTRLLNDIAASRAKTARPLPPPGTVVTSSSEPAASRWVKTLTGWRATTSTDYPDDYLTDYTEYVPEKK